ncbi:MAG TPA: hypothetical protein VF171_00805 [Trueperaceae bacterium]
MKPPDHRTVNELREVDPEAEAVWTRHGVDPRTRRKHGTRQHLQLGKTSILRNGPVDDAEATQRSPEAFFARQRGEP